MTSTFKFYLLLSFLAFCTTIKAQSRAEKSALAKETSKLYYYQFEGQLSSETAETLRNEILGMRFVTEAKIEYKAEKAAGQVRVFTTEKYTDIDTEFEFSIYNLKELLIKNNLFPSVYKSEVIVK